MPFDTGPNRFTAQYDWQLRQPRFYVERIWRPAVAERLARRLWLPALTLVYDYDGAIRWPNGTPFEIPEIDELFDPDNRWMSNFLRADASEQAPRSYSRVYQKLRMIALFNDIRRTQRDR